MRIREDAGTQTSSVGTANALTRRELEVLAELSLGGSYVDVASALFVSQNTVKTHLASVYRKLGVERRADALRVGRELRLI